MFHSFVVKIKCHTRYCGVIWSLGLQICVQNYGIFTLFPFFPKQQWYSIWFPWFSAICSQIPERFLFLIKINILPKMVFSVLHISYLNNTFYTHSHLLPLYPQPEFYVTGLIGCGWLMCWGSWRPSLCSVIFWKDSQDSEDLYTLL